MQQPSKSSQAPATSKATTKATATTKTTAIFCILVAILQAACWAAGQSLHVSQLDPRPTIYSGQVSFGLLLSAHSSLGSEMSTSASQQVLAIAHSRASLPSLNGTSATSLPGAGFQQQLRQQRSQQFGVSLPPSPAPGVLLAATTTATSSDETNDEDDGDGDEHSTGPAAIVASRGARLRRQIFEHSPARRNQHLYGDTSARAASTLSSLGGGGGSPAYSSSSSPSSAPDGLSSGQCSQVNPNALYAGMGAIWASHQANLISDSQFTIGAYVYDSCNDLDVGQRQSVRIVSNLNAFQQTTCESPRGSPISLIIAHGENQLRAIQLLTSFRVPVISTKEHFALEDYNMLTRDQRNFLFSTAHSSRHLAKGAIRFSGRVAAKLKLSPKLPNYHHQNSPKNGLIVISRNLPARFVSHLSEEIPRFLKYELIQSSSPIDQIRSVEALESIMLRPQQVDKPSDEFASSSSTVPSTSSSSLSESQDTRAAASDIQLKLAELIQARPELAKSRLRRRSDGSSSNDDSDSSDSPGLSDSSRMLSPMVMLFITPSEAIDLVTRLRNDLADVSKYYSLIVVTREDITPALKTIFHRGGSRLCAGKAFYVIGPKPDDIGEFGRYFRDTVQIEAETSDHPLVSEFAKFQAGSRITADLDDVGAEPVIKAVWTAAAAFKAVHKRECGSTSATGAGTGPQTGATSGVGPVSSVFRGSSNQDDSKAPGYTSGGRMKSRQQPTGGGGGGASSSTTGSKSAHSECMIKMSKTMSHMVQLKLKRLDHTINSTGLQSLDGFRIRFDEQNELMSNKFSIRHINKECEIEEVGHFSGFEDSKLLLDKEAYERALDSTMPDAWPLPPPPPPPTPTPSVLSSLSTPKVMKDQQISSSGSQITSPSSNGGGGGGGGSGGGQSESGGGTGGGSSISANDENGSNSDSSSEVVKRKYPKRAESVQLDTNGLSKPDTEEEDSTSGNDNSAFEAPPKRLPAKRSRTSSGEISGLASNRRELESPAAITSTGVTIVPTTIKSKQHWPVTTMRSSTGQRGLSDTTEPTTDLTLPLSTARPMRVLKPFPTSAGTSLKDWLPASSQDSESFTQKPPSLQVSTPTYTTLPESDGNADLEAPTRANNLNNTAVKQHDVGPTRKLQSSSTARTLETAATTESSSYISLPGGGSTVRLPTLGLQHQFGRHAFGPASGQPNLGGKDAADHSLQARQLDFLRDLNLIPTPLGIEQVKSLNGDSVQIDAHNDHQSRSNRSQLRLVTI